MLVRIKQKKEAAEVAQVQRIDPVILPEKEPVAAYCRVSTDSKDQMNSYQTQIAYYTQLIAENPEWELVDIYADAGITGTSIEKRDEFKRLLADCRAGKIKRVLVKSVSRFGRNTLDLLETTRELKELGVVVVFEEQGIDTSQMLGEMQLTMFALAAQEESTSTSKNIRRSYQMRMETGQFVGTRPPYGYCLKDGSLKIVPDEAETVRTIFNFYLSGTGINKIVDSLKSGEIATPNKDVWTYSAVKYMLTNERYIGDALLQKSYTIDTLKHIRKKNNGVIPRFYRSSSHEPIIQAEVFRCVQALLKKKNKYQELEKHFFTNKIVCPDCGKHFRRMKCSAKYYWICYSRASKPSDCTPYRLSELHLIITTLNLLASWPGVPTEFDIDVFDEIVEKIIPAEDGTLRFRLRCGLEIKEVMPK